MLGQEVATLINEEREAGTYSVEWNGLTNELKPAGSGVYLIRMITNEFSATAKIILMK
jgi:flagellar hook assembly protein FlgD